MDATESPLGVLIVAQDRYTGSPTQPTDREGECRDGARWASCSLMREGFIPHPTTTSATTMLVAVKAFSKADEAIALLSFAYPDETSMRFRRGPATPRKPK